MPTWEAGTCLITGANQGVGPCNVDLEQLSYVIAIPKGTVISETDLLNFSSYLSSKAKDDDPNDRFYLLGQFVSFEAADTAPSTETATNQQVRVVNMGATGYNLTKWQDGICGYKALLKMHNGQDRWDFLNVHNNVVTGVLTTDSMGAQAMRGISMVQVFTRTIGLPTGAAGAHYIIEFKVGDSKQMRELFTYVQMPDGFDISTVMKPVVDVELTGAFAPGTPTGDYLVRAVTSCGGIDMMGLYATELSSPGAWTFTNTATGSVIAITSVGTQGNSFHVTLDIADPNYPVSGSVSGRFKSVSALEALGVIGYESNTVVMAIG
jgi:hypothetical protein